MLARNRPGEGHLLARFRTGARIVPIGIGRGQSARQCVIPSPFSDRLPPHPNRFAEALFLPGIPDDRGTISARQAFGLRVVPAFEVLPAFTVGLATFWGFSFDSSPALPLAAASPA
jgi:hypothetical protein